MCRKFYLCVWILSILIVCQESHAYYNNPFYDADESINGTAECGTFALNSNSSYIIKGKDGLGSCTWLFIGPKECYPMITCTKFNIKESYYCSQDFLALSDGSADVGQRFCGKHRPHYATSQTSILQVTLMVNSDYGSPDFKCKVSCAKHHLNYNGYGSGYNYHQPFPPIFIPTTALKTTNCDCGKTGPPIKNNTSPAPSSGAAIQTDEGTPVDPGEYRMFVSITLQNQSFPFCSGTLVSDSCILTSAICCTFSGNSGSTYQVLFNAVDSFNTTGSTVAKNVSALSVHPLYNRQTFDYDVCIMTLQDPVKLTGYNSGYKSEPIFQTTCLPPRKTYDQYVNQNVTIVGFSDPNEDFSSNEVIMKANVTIIPSSNCTAQYGTLNEDQGCFLSNDPGICFLDSGDPLFMEVYERYVQIGTASITFACSADNFPQLYTRLSEVNDWIRMVCRKSTWCNDVNTFFNYEKRYYN